MVIDAKQKHKIKQELTDCLSNDTEISRIVVFGSFNQSDSPADMDVAIFQTSNLSYIPLAMKYRRQTRSIARRIPLDIIPVRENATSGLLLDEINKGETIYER
ncbi:MAG: nucleotidyltransferase domain-containing protein [Spartobacteria bacterium]|nr:nucleotidyltransferase domain-containing protein [Spartobacteria bacterium]